MISATRDAIQFSVGEAAKSVARARDRFRLLGAEVRIRHLAIESGHDYNAPMREAMYGWVEKWLRGKGDGDPIKEPEFEIESIDSLRCFPDGRSRPKTIVTIPDFARKEGLERLAALPKPPDHKEHWNAEVQRMRSTLRDQVLGGFPPRAPLAIKSFPASETSFRITTEAGIEATGTATLPAGARASAGTVVIAIPGPESPPVAGPVLAELARPWIDHGFATLTVTDSRFTPRDAKNIPSVAGVADHNPAEWGLWVNRPLLGQWAWDLIRWLDFLEEHARNGAASGRESWKPARPYVLFGYGSMSLPALLAGALDPRATGLRANPAWSATSAATGKPGPGIPWDCWPPASSRWATSAISPPCWHPGRSCSQPRSSRTESRPPRRESWPHLTSRSESTVCLASRIGSGSPTAPI